MQMDADTQTEFVAVERFVSPEGVETVASFCPMHEKGDVLLSCAAATETNQTKNKLEGIFNSVGHTTRVLSASEKEILTLLAVATGAAKSVESANIPNEIRAKEYAWSVNEEGKVVIDLSGFSPEERAEMQAQIDSQLSGKVIIQHS